jgi:C-terminal processing protease CtpA/Prc
LQHCLGIFKPTDRRQAALHNPYLEIAVFPSLLPIMKYSSVLTPWLLCLMVMPAVAAETRSVARAMESITRTDLRTHVDVLADDTFEGREAGARGGHAAAGYLSKQLQQLELKAGGDRGSYYQAFDGNCRNILAVIEGSDPQLVQEVVAVGAHYDHVGYGTQRNSYGPWGYIHNGADDNASGVAALLEVAQALSQVPERPRRTILIAFWDGEEKGLLGSKHWVRSPTVPLSQIKCFLNVDMVGRLTNRRVEVYGSRSAAGLRQLMSSANGSALDLDFTWQMREDSDHWPFYNQSVPILMLHTGLHKDYHRPSDDAHLLNHEGLEEVSRLMFQTVLSLANADQLGKFRSESRRETEHVRKSIEQPAQAPPARLGMTWYREPADSGLKLRALSITRGSAAEQAGLRVGDVVTQINGTPIVDDAVFRQQVLAAAAPVSFTVERPGEAPRTVAVKLHGAPIRIGLMTREDPAEPGVAMVTHVVYGSPAALGEVRVVDRIDAVNGQTFANLAEFSRLLDQAAGSLTLRLERRGCVREATLQLQP